MAIIRIEEYTCDVCGKPIRLEDVHIGQLSVRKRGARGRAIEITLSMHKRCIPVPVVAVTAPPHENGAPPKRSRAKVRA
jgi:hypothetical protein